MAGSRSRFELAWPGAGAVGPEGRDAAWLLLAHAAACGQPEPAGDPPPG